MLNGDNCRALSVRVWQRNNLNIIKSIKVLTGFFYLASYMQKTCILTHHRHRRSHVSQRGVQRWVGWRVLLGRSAPHAHPSFVCLVLGSRASDVRGLLAWRVSIILSLLATRLQLHPLELLYYLLTNLNYFRLLIILSL